MSPPSRQQLTFWLHRAKEEAGGVYKRSLAIFEKELGPDHPELAVDLSNLAELLESQVRVDAVPGKCPTFHI